MVKSSKIYVAGHRGLVGAALVRRLKAAGCTNIICKTRKELDLTNQRDVNFFLKKEKPEYVFLAAAKVGGILANNTYPADFLYQNLMIEANIIHSAYQYGIKKLLFLGSSCIYPKHAPQPMKEEFLLTGLLEPTNEPYAIAKIAGIKMCQSYNRQYGTKFISVMPTNLFGPGDNFNLETAHVLPALIRKFHIAKLLREERIVELKKDLKRIPIGFELDISLGLDYILKTLGITAETVTLWGTGKVFREFLFVDDLADACLFLMNTYDSSEIINIGTGKDSAIHELAEIVKDVVGFQGTITWDKSKPDGTPKKQLDISQINALGWSPTTSLKEGIQKTYRWYLNVLEN